MATVKQVNGFRQAYCDAMAAGQIAAQAMVPQAMVVSWEDRNGNAQREYVADGVCGFAWVVVRPGTGAFAKWLVKMDLASKHYAGGVCIWISDYNQSMTRKEAHAYAMADSLNAAGFNASAGSRID